MTLFFIFSGGKKDNCTTQSSFNATEQQNVIAKFSASKAENVVIFLQVLLNENLCWKTTLIEFFIKIKYIKKKKRFQPKFYSLIEKKYIKKMFCSF